MKTMKVYRLENWDMRGPLSWPTNGLTMEQMNTIDWTTSAVMQFAQGNLKQQETVTFETGDDIFEFFYGTTSFEALKDYFGSAYEGLLRNGFMLSVIDADPEDVRWSDHKNQVAVHYSQHPNFEFIEDNFDTWAYSDLQSTE